MKFSSAIRLLVLLCYLCSLFACEKQKTLGTDDFYRFDKLSKLTLEKPVKIDYFLGVDNVEIPLNVLAYDQEGEPLDAPQEAISFYANDRALPGQTFVASQEGIFSIVGKLAGQVSDNILIRVWDPASLTLRLSAVNSPGTFYATGQDSLRFKVDVLKNGQIVDLNIPFKFYVNNQESAGLAFATKTAGVYKFQIKGLWLVSNELSVTAFSTANILVRLPVIFHEVNTTSLNSATVQRLTDGMTKAFRNQLNLSLAQKDPNAVDLFVEFYPAETSLDGKVFSTPGLQQITSSKTSFTAEDIYSDSFNSFWAPDHYLNIWVYPNITGSYSSSSWAYLPQVTVPMVGLEVSSKGTAPYYPYGIVLNANHLNNTPEEILAHEAGHILGLKHVFDGNGSNFNGCSSFDPDYCADTQYYDRNAYSSNLIYRQRFNRISCSGVEYSSTNFMDYYYGNRNSFTVDQRNRVRHTINYGLWLPTPFNGAESKRSGPLSLVPRPANLKFILPIVCPMPY